MKKMLTIALAFSAMATTAFAQQTAQIQPKVLPAIERTESVHQPAPGKDPVSASAEETQYVWNSNIFRRFGPTGDTNRRDLSVPLDFGGGTVMRGFGQIFAPKTFYPFYNGTIYNVESGRVSRVDQNFADDQEYIDQFKNAGAYTITDIGMPLFRNPRNTPANPGLITIYKTGVNFQANSYKQRGFNSGRSALVVLKELEISQDKGLDSTIAVNDQGDSIVNTTVLDFNGNPESIGEPLSLKASESIIVLYTNEFAEPVVQPIQANDTREWQRVIATEEYGSGDFVEDPNNPGQFLDERANPIDSFKTFAVVMFREDNKDSIYSAWAALVFGTAPNQRRAISDINMTFVGSVELGSTNGVKYHFGMDAKDQGLGNVSPNPVREKSTIAFSLKERNAVRIDLYNSRGENVRNLVDNRYVQGNYTVDLTTENLPNGVYIVRMIAGDEVYTQKLTVNK